MTVIGHSNCPACGESAEIENGLIQKKVSYQEKKQRIATKKMIRELIPRGIKYRVVFPRKSSGINADLNCQYCGYYEKV